MGGLKQGLQDYEFVYNKFWNDADGYDVDNYDGDAIWQSRDRFKAEYDCKQFKQSVARMVAKIKGQRALDDGNGGAMPPSPAEFLPPPTPVAAAPAKAPASATKATPSKVKTPKVMSPAPRLPVTPSAATVAGIPFSYQELVAKDEYVLALPRHLIGWKDRLSND